MAANAGTNPGSTPEVVGVGIAVGVGKSLTDGVGVGDASEEGDPLGVDVGAGLSAAAELHPARTIAMAIAAQA